MTKRRGLLLTTEQQDHVEAEPALVQAADDVSQAQVAIRELLAADPGKTWTFREVQDDIDRWSGTIVSLALLAMRRVGEIEVGDDLGLRVRELQPT